MGMEDIRALAQQLKSELLYVGTRAQDGMVLAGFTPSTGKPFYAKPDDEPQDMNLEEGKKSAAAQRLYVPEADELAIMFHNKATIGRFRDLWYQSATVQYGCDARIIRFSDGFISWDHKDRHAIRLIRR